MNCVTGTSSDKATTSALNNLGLFTVDASGGETAASKSDAVPSSPFMIALSGFFDAPSSNTDAESNAPPAAAQSP
jgi:hypothetical protein